MPYANTTLTSNDESEEIQYNYIDSVNSRIEDNISYATEAGTSSKDSLHNKLTNEHTYSNEDIVLNEVEGVIDRINDDTVRVKLFPDNYANFPHVIFKDQAIIKQGQHIKYMIKRDMEGYRYQEIISINNKQSHHEKELILKLLDEFKYKDE